MGGNVRKRVFSFVLALLILLSGIPVQAMEKSDGFELTPKKIEEKIILKNLERINHAIKAVEKAESSKNKEDIDFALVLVNDLEDSEEKINLLERLKAIVVQEDPNENIDDPLLEALENPSKEIKKNSEATPLSKIGEDNGEGSTILSNEDSLNGFNTVESDSLMEAKASPLFAPGASKDIDQVIKDLQAYEIETVPNPVFASIAGEWTVFSLARSGANVPENYYKDYYKRIEEYVTENIQPGERLHAKKGTDNSRLIVALTAIGKNPQDVAGHNLLVGLNDIDYVTWQGINGPTWALIALDSYGYEIPENNTDPTKEVTREKLINYILDKELLDSSGNKVGGWRLGGIDDTGGTETDIDLTAMAMYALAPYKDKPEVGAALERAVNNLSSKQQKPGGFTKRLQSWDNSEAIAQSIIALSALGIDADKDPRFVKEGGSLLDALFSFQDPATKGFKHLNTSTVNAMATDQAFEALIAYNRLVKNQHSLFNMKDVSLEPLLIGIEIGKSPTKTNYKPGENFNPTGLEVYKIFDNGTKERISNSDLTISTPDLTSPGVKDVSITYNKYKSSFKIMVGQVESTPDAKLIGIRITKLPNKTVYDINERINLLGIEVTAQYDDGSEKTISPADLFLSSPDMSQDGFKKVLLSYGGYSVSYQIEVKPARLERIVISSNPNKLQYKKGEELDLTGLEVIAHYSDKSTKVLSQWEYNVSPLNMDEVGVKSVTISYENRSDNFSIVVLETGAKGAKASVSVTVPPGPTIHNSGWVMQAQKDFEIIEGVDTAFSILQKTGLNLLYNSHASYAGYYVSSIEGLAEFDGGPWSGWMYRVNGWFPNYSSSLYKLKNGDKVEWIYTRDLGKDIGGYVEGVENDDGLGNKTIFVIVSSSEGGIVYPSGKVKVTNKEPVTLTFKAKEGYVLSDILLNGTSIGVADTYTLTDKNVKSTDTIKAVYKKASSLTDEQKKEIEKKKQEAAKKKQEDAKKAKEQKNNTSSPAIFRDIQGHWAEATILEAFNKKYFMGIGDGLFGPDVAMTRGMFVTVLGRMENAQVSKGQNIFTDVDQEAFYGPYVNWAYKNKIVNGVGENKFDPNRAITREEMAKMVSEYLKFSNKSLELSNKVTLKDLDQVSSWAKVQVEEMNKAQILLGDENGNFNPKKTSTRAEVATVLVKVGKIK